jgi:hypothetical protein
VGCINDGVISLNYDGVAKTTAQNLTGTGLISAWPATLTMGSAAPFNGTIGGIDFCSGGNPVACGW